MYDQSVVGDLINFRGLVYSPVNENGVVLLFGKIAQDLNMNRTEPVSVLTIYAVTEPSRTRLPSAGPVRPKATGRVQLLLE